MLSRSDFPKKKAIKQLPGLAREKRACTWKGTLIRALSVQKNRPSIRYKPQFRQTISQSSKYHFRYGENLLKTSQKPALALRSNPVKFQLVPIFVPKSPFQTMVRSIKEEKCSLKGRKVCFSVFLANFWRDHVKPSALENFPARSESLMRTRIDVSVEGT